MVTNSFIYRYKDIIIKKYWYCTELAISDDVFDILHTIDNKHLINLYELFTIISDEEYEQKYKSFLHKKFSKDGYTAKYYQQDSINPILEKSYYLIKNIDELKELIDILSNYHILMEDTKIENSIIQKGQIVIIDPDYYKLSNLDIKTIKENNYKELLKLLQSLFEHFLVDKKCEVIDYFDKLQDGNPIESVSHFEKSLKQVKKPIEIINR